MNIWTKEHASKGERKNGWEIKKMEEEEVARKEWCCGKRKKTRLKEEKDGRNEERKYEIERVEWKLYRNTSEKIGMKGRKL